MSENGYASFEVREDPDTGRRFWFGGEEGWEGAERVGDESGVVRLDPQHFAVGTRIKMIEPHIPLGTPK